MTDKIGLTIEEAADYTGIGRNTMRKLVEWEKIPVLRIGRRYIIRIDVIHMLPEHENGPMSVPEHPEDIVLLSQP